MRHRERHRCRHKRPHVPILAVANASLPAQMGNGLDDSGDPGPKSVRIVIGARNHLCGHFSCAAAVAFAVMLTQCGPETVPTVYRSWQMVPSRDFTCAKYRTYRVLVFCCPTD